MSDIHKLLKIKELSQQFAYEQTDDGFEFSVTITEDTIDLLEACVRTGVLFHSYFVDQVYVELKDLITHKEKTARILLSPEELRHAGLNVYLKWDDLLAFKPNMTTVPDNFLVLSEETVFPSESNSDKVKHYKDICKLLHLLISNADHTQTLTAAIVKEVIFLHKSRLEIPIIYSAESLGEGLDGISIVSSLLEDGSHKEQKTSILKEVLYSLLANIPKQERLQYLLKNFGEFSKRLSENYQLFVSEFSFDDVRKEYEENKRDYFTKLNDVFSSVQTKMLGIPISLALASLKMSAIIDDITFWTNIFLVISIVIYSFMMVMLITNQKHTLNAIKSEYESQMNRLKHQYADQYEQIINIKGELNERYSYQKKCLNWFYVMSLGLIILVFTLFLWNLPWKVIIGLHLT